MESHLAVLSAGEGNSGGHRTLAEKAFETLHTAIITGRLRPGTRLPIEELAQRLEMSPMPIREAVRRLDAAGLVENIPHRGARVSELSVDDLAEVYEARIALEVLAIRRAAERFTRRHAAHARTCLHQLEQVTDVVSAEFAAAHARFHFALYEAAGSAWLLRLIRPVWETSERYCLDDPQALQLEARSGEHLQILQHCEAGDPMLAARALHEHLATTANYLAEAMGSGPLYELDEAA
jgi:DNA-binding GntR family transcriptional regulator